MSTPSRIWKDARLGLVSPEVPRLPVPDTYERRVARIGRGILLATWAALVLFGLGVLVAVWGVNRVGFDSVRLDELGAFLAGTTGVLWAAAGLVAIYVAFLGQMRQSAVQEEQLVDQRAVFARDRYENTFFQLVSLHHQIVNDTIHIEEPDQIVGTQIKLLGQPRPPNQEYRGRDCFARIYNAFRDRYRETVRSQGPMAIEACLERVYEPIYVEYQADLGHYFRHLYTICKFVDRSTIQDKQLYISIIRAQLSSFEFLLLFYNGLSKHGVEKFKPLIEEHGILKNIPLAQLLESDHQERYAESAFER